MPAIKQFSRLPKGWESPPVDLKILNADVPFQYFNLPEKLSIFGGLDRVQNSWLQINEHSTRYVLSPLVYIIINK